MEKSHYDHLLQFKGKSIKELNKSGEILVASCGLSLSVENSLFWTVQLKGFEEPTNIWVTKSSNKVFRQGDKPGNLLITFTVNAKGEPRCKLGLGKKDMVQLTWED